MIPFQIFIHGSAICKTAKGCVLLRRILKNYKLVNESLPVQRRLK